MKIGITTRFQNSYFSGSIPQVALSIGKALTIAKHNVTFLYPKGEGDQFIDVFFNDIKRVSFPEDAKVHYDVIVEVVWCLTAEDRLKFADRVIGFVHYPPVFSDMESCVYPHNQTRRDFTNLHALWTYDFYSKQDIQYLEFLSQKPVVQVPYVWNPDILDAYCTANQVPSWDDSAKRIETSMDAKAPPSLSWCARIVESNASNGSHCIIPLNIVSVIRQHLQPIRICVHNGEATSKNEFFNANIVRNLLLPDISGNIVPRVRLPDLRRDKSLFIAHQRFRPIKSFILDALYLGIPIIHNCEMMKWVGGYYYQLNQISEAVKGFRQLTADYERGAGYFDKSVEEIRRSKLRDTFSPSARSEAFAKALMVRKIPKPIIAAKPCLRVAFANMWDQFQPKHNFFLYLLQWVGSLNNIDVMNDQDTPNVVFFGSLSNDSQLRYKDVPKVYFTGENAPPNKHADTFLNLGFMYEAQENYIRLPLWMTEVNWWGADVNKMVNPKPISVKDATTPNMAAIAGKKKFCAFVATNPNNANRNAAFQILNNWKSVDSGGRLFCNLPTGPIPAGLGGGGGELAKVDFYKDYKFVITYENSSGPGYTTEKIFHAKVAGAVPIYWGDPFVNRDFDEAGFINANQVGKPEQLIELVKQVQENESAWRKMAEIPAINPAKRKLCEQTMTRCAKVIFERILGISVTVRDEDWAEAETFCKKLASAPKVLGKTTDEVKAVKAVKAEKAEKAVKAEKTVKAVKPIKSSVHKRIVVSAATAQFIEPVVNLFASMKHWEPDVRKILYAWPDLTEKHAEVLTRQGVEIRPFPLKDVPFPDFWEPRHYAWKTWILKTLSTEFTTPTDVLYLDAGMIVTATLEQIWLQLEQRGLCFINNDTQMNRHWCHPTFCKNLAVTEEELDSPQVWAGCIGFRTTGAPIAIFEEAATIAKTRETIVGEKWKPYSAPCLGHRHDQSIYSVLSKRYNIPRLPLATIRCDVSMRRAAQLGIPLYNHRGQFRPIVPFAEGIDEAYVISLERRKDRMDTFEKNHPHFCETVYPWKAVDGKTLQLTKPLIHCFRNNDFKWKKSIMGCALSHFGLWEKLANDPIAKHYLILEDDVKFEERWLLTWAQMASSVPADTDVIYLGGVLPPNKPALPRITEAVNRYFAKVAKNTLFGAERRYFHFCNYSYILTKQGAQKLVALVKERGIFTSGDHMIVNHGDTYLNIYFTTPLLADCCQQDDPTYRASDFNNYNRVDTFDSDIWTNTEHFTKEEIENVRNAETTEAKEAKEPKEANPVLVVKTVWNRFLELLKTNESTGLRETLTDIFTIWKDMTTEEFTKHSALFKLFESCVVDKKHPLLLKESQFIQSKIRDVFATKQFDTWTKVLEVLESSGVKQSKFTVFHRPSINAEEMLEADWLHSLFPFQFKSYSSTEDILAVENPIVLYQVTPRGDDTAVLAKLLDEISAKKRTVRLLHISDEFGNNDIRLYDSPAVKHVFRNYWRPDLPKHTTVIPLGYAKGYKRVSDDVPDFTSRSNTWGFAGSLDREGRREMLATLSSVEPKDLHMKETWSSPSPIKGEAYVRHLQTLKFVPCAKGFKSLESFRLYEALEQGAIPLYVPSESVGTVDEFKEQFGKHPMLGFPSWKKVAELLPNLVKQPVVMENHRKALQTWWTDKKQALSRDILAKLAE